MNVLLKKYYDGICGIQYNGLSDSEGTLEAIKIFYSFLGS